MFVFNMLKCVTEWCIIFVFAVIVAPVFAASMQASQMAIYPSSEGMVLIAQPNHRSAVEMHIVPPIPFCEPKESTRCQKLELLRQRYSIPSDAWEWRVSGESIAYLDFSDMNSEGYAAIRFFSVDDFWNNDNALLRHSISASIQNIAAQYFKSSYGKQFPAFFNHDIVKWLENDSLDEETISIPRVTFEGLYVIVSKPSMPECHNLKDELVNDDQRHKTLRAYEKLNAIYRNQVDFWGKVGLTAHPQSQCNNISSEGTCRSLKVRLCVQPLWYNHPGDFE